jgi:hypothetical protein
MDKYTFQDQVRHLKEFINDTKMSSYERKLKIHGMVTGLEVRYELDVPRWIPITDHLPDKSGKYLVTVQNGNVYAGTYDAYTQKFQCAATAWMPLPEPYEATS